MTTLLKPTTAAEPWNWPRLAERGGDNFAPNPSRPDWSPQAISRFFGWMGTNPHHQDVYFSLQVGVAVLRFLEMAGVLNGKVIDYGCGPGYLLNLLSEKEIDLYGADFSAEAVEIVNRRLAGRRRWNGVQLIRTMPSPELPKSNFDLVTCIETIEHLPDEPLEATLAQLRRIVKPGGYALLTTPCAENLERGMGYCPFCEAEFHAWQHVRSFTPESLRKILEERGWEVTFCESLTLWRFMPRPWPGKWDFNLRYAMGSWHRIWAAIKDRLAPRPFPNQRLLKVLSRPGPHLIALARKRDGSAAGA
jgi:2-polyprenyl-3-methyl-5-hydroxy-6-metoxy-1,4-benzoquinol methylase